MKTIDLHVDTLAKLVKDIGSEDLYENATTSVDIKRLVEADYLAQFFAMFPETEKELLMRKPDFSLNRKLIDEMMEVFYKNLDANKDKIAFAGNYEDILKNIKENKLSAFLTIEDCGAVEGDFQRIRDYYKRGVRLMTLTWNFENCMGFPNSKDFAAMRKGLKPFGKEAVEMMNELGIIVDVSHLSDGGFWDVKDISKKPFIASHSNSRDLVNHPRNLTDEMIKSLADSGGVIGLNFYSGFLNTRDDSYSSLEDIKLHLDYIKNKGGEDVLAMGTDFDGIGSEVEVESCKQMPSLFEYLKKNGWKDRWIEKLQKDNVLRVIRETL